MGTSRRYGHVVDAQMSERIAQRTAESGPLETLTREELRLDEVPWTTDPKPKPVKAWVRFAGAPLCVDAEACMWTETAVAIQFQIAGRGYRCWVWRGAVEHR